MNNVIHITSSDGRTEPVLGGGYLDDSALVAILDHDGQVPPAPAWPVSAPEESGRIFANLG
jgi:hypothetical protein